MTFKFAAIAAAAVALIAGSAHAQDLTAWYAQQMAAQNAQMNSMLGGMTQQNLRNPQVMAMKSVCGQGLTDEQFVYKYMATGGCSAQGYANYNATTNNIANQQRAAMDAYYRSIEASRQAYSNYTQGYSNNQQEAGRVLMGNQTYFDPAAGRNVVLRYIQPGQTYTDPSSRRTYTMDSRGQYWSTNGNGSWTPVNPARR